MSEANLPATKPLFVLNLYETDFHAWTQEQAALLRSQQWSHLDLPNLIEEIESLGKQERQELRNRLSILIGHLLKWEYQPQRRSRSWLATIRIQRRDTLRLLKENPSLKPYLEDALQESYENGRDLAMAETDLPEQTFPADCLYGLDAILDDRFYPGNLSELLYQFGLMLHRMKPHRLRLLPLSRGGWEGSNYAHTHRELVLDNSES